MITLLCILILIPFVIFNLYVIDKLYEKILIFHTKISLEKSGYYATKEELKAFNKYLKNYFGVDILDTKIIIFNEKIKIFKVKDNFILADGMTLKVIANESEMLTYLENKNERLIDLEKNEIKKENK